MSTLSDTIKCSVCIATFNKAAWLKRTLLSLIEQKTSFVWEVIVIDDGSTDDTPKLFPFQNERLRHIRIDREPVYRNPAIARNLAYQKARGDVIICQSDDTIYTKTDGVERLVNELQPGIFNIATVWNTDMDGNHKGLEQWPSVVQLTGPQNHRPFFFLGSLLRRDLYRAGGNDELYTGPGREDQAFGDSLTKGLGLVPRYVSVVGHHVEHPRPENLRQLTRFSNHRYRQRQILCNRGLESWLSPGAPWPYTDNEPMRIENEAGQVSNTV